MEGQDLSQHMLIALPGNLLSLIKDASLTVGNILEANFSPYSCRMEEGCLRVLGRKNWGTVIGQGVQSGLTMGLLMGLLLLLFTPAGVYGLFAALGLGIVLGIGSNAFVYSLSRGRRDFTSVTQTVATKYEVLCEHKVAQQARDMLLQLIFRQRPCNFWTQTKQPKQTLCRAQQAANHIGPQC